MDDLRYINSYTISINLNRTDYFTIAIPAGRLAKESIGFFKRSGLADFDDFPESRALCFSDKSCQLRILLVRNLDVPTYVLQGGADAGIIGRDVLEEGNYDLTVPFALNFGKCRLSVAAMPQMVDKLLQSSHLRVATKYPRLAADFFYRLGISCEVIKLHGSVEIAPMLSLSDCIVDLVSTGLTLKENGLVEVRKISDFCAVLVVNRSTYALHAKRLFQLLTKFQKQIQ